MSNAAQVRAEWLSRLLSTAPVERPEAEAAVRQVYLACDLPPPRCFLWFDSPYLALWAMALVERRPRYSMATNRAGDEPIQARAGNDRTFAGQDVQECQPVGLEIAARGSGQTDGAYDAAGPQASAAAKKIQTSILLARIDFTKTSTTRLRSSTNATISAALSITCAARLAGRMAGARSIH